MSEFLSHLFISYGYWLVAGVVAIERLGVPLPGETALIIASALAATSPTVRIEFIVLSAAIAAILGNACGYWFGRTFGSRLVLRYGHYVGLTEPRIRLGQYIFKRHGAYVVMFGQFFPVLRELAAILAGTNRVELRPFWIASVTGAFLWAAVFGFGSYWLGKGAEHTAASLDIVLLLAAAFICLQFFLYLRRNEARLQAQADKVFNR